MKKYLEKALKEGKKIEIDGADKVVSLSDFHLGSGWANDDSLKNNLFMFEALKYYYDNDYLVIFNGDTFDIAENKDIRLIEAAHEDIIWLMTELYNKGKLIYIKGNHDAYLKSFDFENRRSSYTKKLISFMPGIELYDYAILNFGSNHYCIMHGHQNSFVYRYFNRIVCFFVGLLGKIEKILSKDPTGVLGSLKDFTKEIEEFEEVAEKNNFKFVCGHTHAVVLDREKYFNEGCGVFPRCITCGEIINGEYSTYKWSYVVKDKQVYIDKTKIIN